MFSLFPYQYYSYFPLYIQHVLPMELFSGPDGICLRISLFCSFACSIPSTQNSISAQWAQTLPKTSTLKYFLPMEFGRFPNWILSLPSLKYYLMLWSSFIMFYKHVIMFYLVLLIMFQLVLQLFRYQSFSLIYYMVIQIKAYDSILGILNISFFLSS